MNRGGKFSIGNVFRPTVTVCSGFQLQICKLVEIRSVRGSKTFRVDMITVLSRLNDLVLKFSDECRAHNSSPSRKYRVGEI